jgi:hypothetical protein
MVYILNFKDLKIKGLRGVVERGEKKNGMHCLNLFSKFYHKSHQYFFNSVKNLFRRITMHVINQYHGKKIVWGIGGIASRIHSLGIRRT